MASRHEKEQRRSRRRSKQQEREKAVPSRWWSDVGNTRVLGRITVCDVFGTAVVVLLLYVLQHYFGIVSARSLPW